MGFTFDTKTKNAKSYATNITMAYTCGADARLLVVVFYSGTTMARTGGPPTFNGISFTQIGAGISGSEECYSEIWFLLNPPVSSSYNIIFPNTNNLYARLDAYSFNCTGYPQLISNTSRNDTVANPSLTLNDITDGAVVISILNSGYANAVTGRSNTILYEVDEGVWNDASQYELKSGAGNTTHSFTQSSDDVVMFMAAFDDNGEGLAAPESITYPETDKHGEFEVSWDESEEATSYFLEESIDEGESWDEIYSGADTSYFRNVTSGSYIYRVRAHNNNGYSDYTTGGTCVVDYTPVNLSEVPEIAIKITTSSEGVQ